MKIYILKEYNTERTFCVSENIHMIKKCLLNKDYFNREYNDYPILIIWEKSFESIIWKTGVNYGEKLRIRVI